MMSVRREILLAFSLMALLTAVFVASIAPFGGTGGFDEALAVTALMLMAIFVLVRRNAANGPLLSALLWIGAVGGLTLRVWIFLAQPTASIGLGLDLFAGEALLQGMNPYAFTVGEMLGSGLRVGDAELERARAIVAQSPTLTGWLTQALSARDLSPSRIDTPLLALPFLALSQVMTPGAATGWFGILLASDLLTFGLLLLLLRRLRLAMGWVLLFWVNPVWLLDVYGLAAPLGLVAPVILLALWASISERAALTGLLLAVATALNLWLAGMLAVFLRTAGRRPGAWRRAAYGLVGFVLVFGILALLHRAFGAPLYWFGALTVTGEASGSGIGRVFALEPGGLIPGASRLAAPLWVLLVGTGALLMAWPPLPDQAQRTIRVGILGFLAFYLTTQTQAQGLLVLVVLAPLIRSSALVLAAGLGTIVAALIPVITSLNLSLLSLSPEMLARLVAGVIIGLFFVITWIASVRRNQPIEYKQRI